MKVKSCILVFFLCISFSMMKAQDVDCPCWGEKKAFVTEFYNLSGICNTDSHTDPNRFLAVPGISLGIKFNKKQTLALGFNYVALNNMDMGPLIFIFAPIHYHDHQNTRTIETFAEWKFQTLWKKNMRTEVFLRLGPTFHFYSKYYNGEDPSDYSVSTNIHLFKNVISTGYNFNFKMNKHIDLCLSPFFQYFLSNYPFPDHYNYFAGIKAGLKYSKYLN